MSYKKLIVSKYKIISGLNFKDLDKKYPIIKKLDGDIRVTDDIPNVSSIRSSLNDYEILKGTREIPLSELADVKHAFYAADDWKRSEKLAAEIKENKYIDPLIVVLDNEGLYILEGAHRWVALAKLGLKSIPALLVIDLEKIN